MATPSATETEITQSAPQSEFGTASVAVPVAPSYPPFPPYATEPAPPSVADTIFAGNDIRRKHKSMAKRQGRPPPKPAKPKTPKATDVKFTAREMRAHARCLRRHGAVLTDRLEFLSKPQRRTIIYLWREHADRLPAETINRLRNMLDADEPFKPDQAYEYFINLRKSKRKQASARKTNQMRKDLMEVCAEKRFVWARNATVAFARGIQLRLSRPGKYNLGEKMQRLSDIILGELCSYMNVKCPSRRCNHPKAKFLLEMSDKVAVWIDDIIQESDDRMLMMDFDEDDEIADAADWGRKQFPDDFLDMMGGRGGRGGDFKDKYGSLYNSDACLETVLEYCGRNRPPATAIT